MRIITGKARGLKLETPKNYDIRPTTDRVKESLFNIIGNRIINTKVLDLFAGTGNLGLEAWSRGAKQVVFIDKSNESLKIVKKNIEKTKASNDVKVINMDFSNALNALAKKKEKFDFVFSDPPYNKDLLLKIMNKIDENEILNNGGYLIVERSKQEELTLIPKRFELVREVRYGATYICFLRWQIENNLI